MTKANANSMSKDAIRIEEETAKVWDLRKAGKSYREIGKALGISRMTVCTRLNKAYRELKELNLKAAEDHRDMELARLDRVVAALEVKLARNDVNAAQAMVRVVERRAKLLGLDAPTKTESEHTVNLIGHDGKEVRRTWADAIRNDKPGEPIEGS